MTGKYNKIGFIGTGNMGGALAKAVRNRHPDAELLLCNRTLSKAEALAKELDARVADANTVAGECDVVFLGVKPIQIAPLLDSLSPAISARDAKPLLVSMAAAITLDQLEEHAGGSPVIRIMPNTPVAIGKGTTVYTCGREASQEDRAALLDILSGSGSMIEIDEHQMDAAGEVSGCGPAFVDLFLEALADGGVAAGLPRPLAMRLAEEMTAGAALLALETGKHPGELKDAVCSPGGSTIKGVRALERNGFRSAVIEAVLASSGI